MQNVNEVVSSCAGESSPLTLGLPWAGVSRRVSSLASCSFSIFHNIWIPIQLLTIDEHSVVWWYWLHAECGEPSSVGTLLPLSPVMLRVKSSLSEACWPASFAADIDGAAILVSVFGGTGSSSKSFRVLRFTGVFLGSIYMVFILFQYVRINAMKVNISKDMTLVSYWGKV